MDNKKKIIVIIAGILAVIIAAAVTVYAYLQSTVEQPNVFTVGSDSLQVTEVFTEPETMRMTNQFEKKVMVQNTGTSEQFVRVYLDFSDSRIRDNSEIVYTKNGTSQEKTWSEFLSDLPENWVYVSDTDSDGDLLGGYFYYTKKLSSGETTNTLIDGVKTDFSAETGDDNVDNINDFDIIVYTESVQTTEIDDSGTVYNDGDWKTAWKTFLEIS